MYLRQFLLLSTYRPRYIVNLIGFTSRWLLAGFFFLDSKKLSLTFTQRCNQSFSIFIMLELVFLNGFAVVGSKGGYFVNLLQFPSLCPLTSFCAAWNPTGPHKNITLIDHGKIQLAVDGIHILRCSI